MQQSYTIVDIKPTIQGIKAMELRLHIQGEVPLHELGAKIGPALDEALKRLLPKPEKMTDKDRVTLQNRLAILEQDNARLIRENERLEAKASAPAPKRQKAAKTKASTTSEE